MATDPRDIEEHLLNLAAEADENSDIKRKLASEAGAAGKLANLAGPGSNKEVGVGSGVQRLQDIENTSRPIT